MGDGAMADEEDKAHKKKKRKRQKLPILVIFDMNGVLLMRSEFTDTGEREITLRPHVDKLIETLWRLYPRVNVAVWSSMSEKNLYPLVYKVFGAKADELAFVWDQQYCTKKHRADMHKPLLRKDLKWLDDGQFSDYLPEHVLLVDDDPIKCTKNPEGTAIHPPTFEGGPDEELLRMARYLEALADSDCASVPEFVLSNPYGDFKEKTKKDPDPYDASSSMVEIYVPDLGKWLPQAVKSIQELKDGSWSIQGLEGAEEAVIVPADCVRDLGSAEAKGGDRERAAAKAGTACLNHRSVRESERLPAGWRRMESKSKPGNYYYYNTRTGESSSTLP
eukprot:TRINITY_DN65126_c0_g1_i1.p2 TRINITY_DN65126_c0_g1~~TRINITY_DN65126_c0_g1_i1.p2  ORF type:complete len:333 (-),score=78.10 TRINITY_DN65126_c0_g1_i1:25-1023(-)